jgi:DNA-binding XRE family transcriptional regulator
LALDVTSIAEPFLSRLHFLSPYLTPYRLTGRFSFCGERFTRFIRIRGLRLVLSKTTDGLDFRSICSNNTAVASRKSTAVAVFLQDFFEQVFTMAFHLKLRELREAKGVTQAQLAESAGLSKGGIADLEQGRRKPTLETAQKLARALGVSCTAFDEQQGEPVADESKRGRGRPAKPASDEPVSPKKRGRPRKS